MNNDKKWLNIILKFCGSQTARCKSCFFSNYIIISFPRVFSWYGRKARVSDSSFKGTIMQNEKSTER